eukprot:m.88519 g.88519  ORF g.88519 m.88519 type:complete len:375 (-) comp15191_c0_seq1:467-1591(-)
MQEELQELRTRVRVLEHQLEMEHAHAKQLEADKRKLRQACVALQLQSEHDAEMLSHSLLKRLQDMEAEKKRLEESGATDAHTQQLQEEIDRLKRDKVRQENELEMESECAVNRLAKEKCKLEAQNHKLEEQLQRSCVSEQLKATQQVVAELSREVMRLRHMLVATGKADCTESIKYMEEQEALREDNLRLTRKLEHAMNRIASLEKMSVRAESDLEFDDERMFNVRRSRDNSVHSSGTSSPIPTPVRTHMTPSPHAAFPASSPSQSWWPHARIDRLEARPGNDRLRLRSGSDAATCPNTAAAAAAATAVAATAVAVAVPAAASSAAAAAAAAAASSGANHAPTTPTSTFSPPPMFVSTGSGAATSPAGASPTRE